MSNALLMENLLKNRQKKGTHLAQILEASHCKLPNQLYKSLSQTEGEAPKGGRSKERQMVKVSYETVKLHRQAVLQDKLGFSNQADNVNWPPQRISKAEVLSV